MLVILVFLVLTNVVTKSTLYLTPVDILKMKTALNIRSDKFLKEYTTLQTLKDTGIPLVKLLMRKNSKGACIFLDGSKGCSIYQNRPQVCRSYPLGLGALSIQDMLSYKLKVSLPKHVL